MNSLYDQGKANRKALRDATNQKVRTALQFDIGSKPAPDVRDSRHAYVKAIELTSDLLDRFTMPMRPEFYSLGVIKNASNRNGTMLDGVIKIGARFKTLMGHKTDVEIPVVVKNSRLLEPSVFFLDGAPYIICQATVDQLVKHGTMAKGIENRKMFQPPLMDKPMESSREPIINRDHMFSPGTRSPWQIRRSENEPRPRINIEEPAARPEVWTGDVQDEHLDVAERTHEGLISQGANVKLTEDFETRERGGVHMILPKGESGRVVKDVEGDGKMLTVCFEELECTINVPKHFLKSAGAPTVDQIRHEIRSMLREGYQDVDIREAIARKYPENAQEALQGLS